MKLFLLTALTGISLQAATLFVGTFTTTPNFSPGEQTDFSQTINLPQFNAALGTLTGVEIVVDTQMNKSGSMTNNGTISGNLRYFYAGAVITVNGVGVSHQQDGTASPFQAGESFSNVAPGATVTVTSLTEQSLGNIFNPANLAAFIGGGQVAYSVIGDADLATVCGSGNCATNIATLMGARLSLTYTYTPTPTNEVPEPATFALLGAGLVGLGLLKRRS